MEIEGSEIYIERERERAIKDTRIMVVQIANKNARKSNMEKRRKY